MSKSLTSQSDQILADAAMTRKRVQMNRSIGSKSHALKREHFWKKLGRMAIAIGAVIVAAGIVGATISDIAAGGRTLFRLRVPASDHASAAELVGRCAGLGLGSPQIVTD